MQVLSNLYEKYKNFSAQVDAEKTVSQYHNETKPKTTYFKFKIHAQIAIVLGLFCSSISIYTSWYSISFIFDFIPEIPLFMSQIIAIVFLLLLEMMYERLVSTAYYDYRNGDFKDNLTNSFKFNDSLFFAILVTVISFSSSIYGGFLRKADVQNNSQINIFDESLSFLNNQKLKINSKYDLEKSKINDFYDSLEAVAANKYNSKKIEIDSLKKQTIKDLGGVWNKIATNSTKSLERELLIHQKDFETTKENLNQEKKSKILELDKNKQTEIELLSKKNETLVVSDNQKDNDKISIVSYLNILLEFLKLFFIIFVARYKYQSAKDSSSLGLIGDGLDFLIAFSENNIQQKASFYQSIAQQQPSPIFVGQQQQQHEVPKKRAGFVQGSMFENQTFDYKREFEKYINDKSTPQSIQTALNMIKCYEFVTDKNNVRESFENSNLTQKFALNPHLATLVRETAKQDGRYVK